MANKLKNLVITKVALVDEGSCSAAHIKLFKRKGGQDMSFDEILKSLSPEQQTIVKAAMDAAKASGNCPICGKAAGQCTCKADAAEMEKKCGKLKKEKEDLEAEVTKLRNPEGGKSEDEILKGLDPAVRTMIEKSRNEAAAATAAIKKMKEDADASDALAKAKSLSNLGADEEKLAKSLQVLKSKDETVYNDIYNVLKSAEAKVVEGLDLGEVGTSVTKGKEDNIQKAADVAWIAVEKAAEEISKSKSISKEAAISQVITEQPDLYNAYLNALN